MNLTAIEAEAPLRERAGAGAELTVPAGLTEQALYLPLIRRR